MRDLNNGEIIMTMATIDMLELGCGNSYDNNVFRFPLRPPPFS